MRARALLRVALGAAALAAGCGRAEAPAAAPSGPAPAPDGALALPARGATRVERRGDRYDVAASEAAPLDALTELSMRAGFRIERGNGPLPETPRTLWLRDVPLERAVAAILAGVPHSVHHEFADGDLDPARPFEGRAVALTRVTVGGPTLGGGARPGARDPRGSRADRRAGATHRRAADGKESRALEDRAAERMAHAAPADAADAERTEAVARDAEDPDAGVRLEAIDRMEPDARDRARLARMLRDDPSPEVRASGRRAAGGGRPVRRHAGPPRRAARRRPDRGRGDGACARGRLRRGAGPAHPRGHRPAAGASRRRRPRVGGGVRGVGRGVSDDALLLWPPPRELRRAPGVLRLERGAVVRDAADPAACAPARRVLEAALARAGVARAPKGLRSRSRSTPATSRSRATGSSCAKTARRLSAGEPRGLLHAAHTVAQLLRERAPVASGARPPRLARSRAARLHARREPRPRPDARRRSSTLVEILASLKLNVLQLYVEHTFAYAGPRGSSGAARRRSPRTRCARSTRTAAGSASSSCRTRTASATWSAGSGTRPTARSARSRAAATASRPGTARRASWARSTTRSSPASRAGASTSAATRRSTSARAGARPPAASGAAAASTSTSCSASSRTCTRRGRHVEFWGDIVLQHPELIPELPRAGVTADAWFYEAPQPPGAIPDDVVEVMARFGYTRELLSGFGGHAPQFAAAGIPFQVCPGTSSWNTFVGRWSNARANVRDAVDGGARFGAEGMLLTDWGDNGHLQPFAVSLAPLALAAGLAWHEDGCPDAALEPALGEHVFPSPALAASALALGDAHLETGLESVNATPFFVAMRLRLDRPPPGLLLRGTPEAAKLERTVERLDAEIARLGGDEPIARDLRQAARLARHGTLRLLRGRLGRGPDAEWLRRDLTELVATQRERWLASSRPGGLPDSLTLLERALAEYGAS